MTRIFIDRLGLGAELDKLYSPPGIYIAASLFWLWAVEGQPPTRADLIGAVLAVLGAVVIIAFAERAR